MKNPLPNEHRRRLLKANLAAASLFLPLPYAQVWAQSDGAMKLLRLPKLALVIGNSSYKNAPPLGNPGNDAKAISETLRQSGFDVTLKLDATRDDMAAAMRAHVQTLAARKAVGLFYFAGHGLQLAWRNYLVPVDAAVRRLDDIQGACVDLTSLIDGINKASNPMNVVILDACRDNPFGDIRVENRGLSQIDVPHSTLLAYATAPGNVASDGDGANGLYTENLLREMRVPDAKIEDVFKRVRLNVRRRTNGQQIPWESTSLEEDFWFVPPKELKKVSDAEAVREFEAELAIWEKIKEANEPAPVEDYLRRYPSGRFSELAQLRLDQVLAKQGEQKVRVISAADNPYSKGTAVANTNRKVGDSYTFREFDLYTKIENKTFTKTITEITDTEVIYRGGLRTDLLGNPLRTPWGAVSSGPQIWGVDYTVGKRWTSRHKQNARNGVPVQVEAEVRVVAREKITVPAGTFNAFVVVAKGYAIGAGINTSGETKRWIVPDQVRDHIAIEVLNRSAQGGVLDSHRQELVSFKQA
jgi:uncharacterized caspase-like protein